MKLNAKLVFFALILFFLFYQLQAQNQLQVQMPFYDAQELDEALKVLKEKHGKAQEIDGKLKELKGKEKDDAMNELGEIIEDMEKQFKKIWAILSKYKKVDNLVQIKTEFGDNPFFKDFIRALEEIEEITGLDFSGEKKEEEVEVIAPKAIGLPSPVMVVDALGSFIAKRFKEELIIAYLNKFRVKLSEAKDKWGLLFPSTCDFLIELESHIFNFKVFIPTLKQVFQSDLNHLGENVIKFLKKKESSIIDTEKKKILNSVFFFWDVYWSLKNGDHPADVIENLPNSLYFEKIVKPNFLNYIRLLALISRNLRDKDTNGWIKPTEFKIFLKDSSEQMRGIFIGLIYAKEKEELRMISFGSKNLVTDILNDNEKIKKFNEYMHRITVAAKVVQNQLKNMEEAEKLGYKEYHAYLNTVLQIIEIGYDLKKEFTDTSSVDEKIQDLLEYGKRLLAVSKNIHDKAYGAALVNAFGILKDLLSETEVKSEIIKYGTFMVAMVNAQNAKEIERVLESAALPVGSYRIKRTNFFTISLNAYPGIFGGRERLTADKEEIMGKPEAWSAAFTTPIGLDFSWGKCEDGDEPSVSYGFFISAIDIGALVSLRLSGEDKGLPEFKWKNILAPGIYLMLGWKNKPISIGFGVQYGPQLRKIKAAEVIAATAAAASANGEEETLEAVIESSAFRFGIIIAVDIPIFNIYTK